MQWNIRGYTNNYYEPIHINNKNKPMIITLQEHIYKNKQVPIPRNYQIINKNNTQSRYGETAFLIHNAMQYKEINITNQTENILAIKITTKITLTIIIAYIPPNDKFTSKKFKKIYNSF